MHSSRSNTEMCCQLAFIFDLFIYTRVQPDIHTHIYTHIPLSLSPSHCHLLTLSTSWLISLFEHIIKNSICHSTLNWNALEASPTRHPLLPSPRSIGPVPTVLCSARHLTERREITSSWAAGRGSSARSEFIKINQSQMYNSRFFAIMLAFGFYKRPTQQQPAFVFPSPPSLTFSVVPSSRFPTRHPIPMLCSTVWLALQLKLFP